MVLLILALCLAFCIFFLLTVLKNVSSPPVILAAVFLASFFIIHYVYAGAESNTWFYGCYVIAVICFSFGFVLQLNGAIISLKPIQCELHYSSKAFRITIFIEYILMGIRIPNIILVALNSASNLWIAVRRGVDEIEFFALFDLFQIMFFLTIICVATIHPDGINKKRTVMCALPLIPSILVSHRGQWFMAIIGVIFIFLYVRRPVNIKVIKWGGIGAAVLLALIIVSSFWKFSEAISDPNKLLRSVLNSYFSSPFVAFRRKMENDYVLKYGANTFRFFIAALHAVGLAGEPVEIIQPYTLVNGYWTNVYTGLSYYADDFGLWWSFCIEFFFGLLYGALYKKVFQKGDLRKNSIFYIVLLSVLMYPLINQFFDDRYFSVLSQWLKQTIFLFVITRPRFFEVARSRKEA